jgi:hypothetical protein
MRLRKALEQIRAIEEQHGSARAAGPSFWRRYKPEILLTLAAALVALALWVQSSAAVASPVANLPVICSKASSKDQPVSDCSTNVPVGQPYFETFNFPTPDSLVRFCGNGCSWSDARFVYRRFGDLQQTDVVDGCQQPVEPGLSNIPGLAPTAWSAATDPCKGYGPIQVANLAKQPAAPAIVLRNAQVSWTAPTSNSDGTPLMNLSGYRIEYAASSAGPWTQIASAPASATTATPLLPLGPGALRMFALTSTGTSSDPSGVLSFTVVAPSTTMPNAPQILSDAAPKDLSLVDGSSTGLRPVYAKTATGTRGTKIGDLAVGSTTQPASGAAFARVKCDAADRIVSGTTQYARVIDTRAPTQYRAGYVSGCVRYGLQ